MEVKQIDAVKLAERYNHEKELDALAGEFGKMCGDYNKKRKKIQTAMDELAKEIDSAGVQMKLFTEEGKEEEGTEAQRHRGTHSTSSGQAKYPEKEEKITVPGQEDGQGDKKDVKKKRLKQGDTMKVERTLRAVAVSCDGIDENDVIGCCQCERQCSKRDARFGMAIQCENTLACSANCPRLMEDVVEDMPADEQIKFRGDYRPNIAGTKKQIRFQSPGSTGWGKPEKFTNKIQYFARLEELRKNPKYMESL